MQLLEATSWLRQVPLPSRRFLARFVFPLSLLLARTTASLAAPPFTNAPCSALSSLLATIQDLWVGYGCPLSASSFECQVGQEGSLRPFGGEAQLLQTTATLRDVRSRVLFVIVGSYSELPHAGVAYNLSFQYIPAASATATPQPSVTPPGSVSAIAGEE